MKGATTQPALIKKIKKLGRHRGRHVPERPAIDLVAYAHEEHISDRVWESVEKASVSVDAREVTRDGRFDLDTQFRVATFVSNCQIAGDPGLERLENRKRPYKIAPERMRRARPPQPPQPASPA